MTLNALISSLKSLGKTRRMPALFIGHGSPMNGVEDNIYAKAWDNLGKSIQKPKAIISISAHWFTDGVLIHATENPKTIHDFWGFPKELYDLTYPCPGSPELASETKKIITSAEAVLDYDWGIDHGTWIVLHRMYPEHDIPVFQLSIDMTKSGEFHYKLGKELSKLRDHGVLIMGSGNIVHNLGLVNFEELAKPYEWAIEFDKIAEELISKGDDKSLVEYAKLGQAAHLSIPTPDHYFPLLYILGAKQKGDTVTFPVTGISHASVSMRAVMFS